MTETLFTRVVQPTAIVSVTLSLSVVFTALMFPEMVRGRVFTQLVVLMSVCDALGNWPYFLGYYPANGTILCSFEGFCNLYFFPCSWMLTTFLMKLFRDLVITCKINVPLHIIIGVSMGIPLLFTLLVLTTNTYGNSDDYNAINQPCVYTGNPYSGFIWHVVTYDCLLYLCLAIMIYYLFEILFLECKKLIATNTQVYVLMKRVLILYPIALLICWVPHAICICVTQCYGSLDYQTYVDAAKIAHGGIVALILFTMSSETRHHWLRFGASIVNCGKSRTVSFGPNWNTETIQLSRDQWDTESESSNLTLLTQLPEDTKLEAMLTRAATISIDPTPLTNQRIGAKLAIDSPTALNSNF